MPLMRRADVIKRLPGFSLAILCGFGIWFASSLVSWIDPLVAGILCGMIVRSLMGQRRLLSPGLEWTPRALIPPGIILYGAHLRFDFAIVSPLTWLQLLVGLIIVVWLATTVGKWLKISQPTSLLLAVGTAVCGASAIVIASEAVKAERRDTATTLLVITIWGLIGLVCLPLLAGAMGMNVHDQALFYSTTLQQTGLVKAAALHAGEGCLSMAMTIKTARIATLIPLLFIVGTITLLPQMRGPIKNKSAYRVRVPWYLWGFIIAGVCFTFIPVLAAHASSVHPITALIWTMAMVSIGLTVDIRSVLRSIGRPLLAGLIVWIGLLIVFLYTYLNTYSFNIY